MPVTVEDYFEHYGVKGMRWGVKKDRGPSSEDSVYTRSIRAKAKAGPGKADALTNAELKALVERLNLEQQHSKLTATPGAFDKGMKFSKNIIAVGATANAAIAFAKSPAGKAIAAQIAKKAGK